MGRYRLRAREAIYYVGLGIAGIGVLSLLSLRAGLSVDDYGPLLLFTGITVFTLHWGFIVDRVGYTSLDRVAHIAALLVLGPLLAAWVVAAAAFIWAFTSMRRHRASLTYAFARGCHNAGMFIFVILISGTLYARLGGTYPLQHLGPHELFLAAVLAALMQVFNEVFMAANVLVRRIPLSEWFSPASAFVEMASFPVAVFTALMYNTEPRIVFTVFLLLLCAMVVVVSSLVERSIANGRLIRRLDLYKHELERKVEQRTGALELQKKELHALTESLREASMVKEHLLHELQQKTAELDRQTKEDSLTGLFNRRYMDRRLAAEFKRARRHGHALAIAMADIDHFKAINDDLSHQLGDEVLRQIADLLRARCRESDIIARYGGEEFVLVFPETDLECAVTVCEQVREAIECHDWRSLAPGLAVTTSIGIADDLSVRDYHVMLDQADKLLYEAKRAGRNRVRAPLAASRRETGGVG